MEVTDIFDIKDVPHRDWYTNSITCVGTDNIVLSGGAGGGFSHITVIDVKGNIGLTHKILGPSETTFAGPACYSTALNDFRVAMACLTGEIGILDLRDGMYIEIHAGGFIDRWSEKQFITCIAADTSRNQLLVGLYKRKTLIVFDDHLNYERCLKLPEIIKWPIDAAVSGDIVYVCDREGKQACAIAIQGTLLHMLSKPKALVACDIPVSVCTDDVGYVYVLWRSTSSPGEQNCIAAQYAQDGGHKLQESSPFFTDGESICVKPSGNDLGKRVLLVITAQSRKIRVYPLNDKRETFE